VTARGRHTDAYWRGGVIRGAHRTSLEGCDCWGQSHRETALGCDLALRSISYLRDMCPNNDKLQQALAKASSEIRRELRRHQRDY